MRRMIYNNGVANMKSTAAFLLFYLMTGAAIAPVYAEAEMSLATPPASLEKWYKPGNERQVWLHTMFSLRREMQAVAHYAQQQDQAGMKKWAGRLEKNYLKIAEMVPEWKAEIKPRLFSELSMFISKGDAPRVEKTLQMIQRTCDDCHRSYQPLVAALYRSPHYDDISIQRAGGEAHSFEDNMHALSASVNRILIALDDGNKSGALQSSRDLTGQLQNLGDSCQRCHEKDEYPRERILGRETQQRLTALESDINAGRVKDSQKLMGEIAVTVCARCHNTHRIVNDLRNALLPDE